MEKSSITVSLKSTDKPTSINIIKVKDLNLYVISDVDNFGANWVRVVFHQNVFSTQTLLGPNEDIVSPIARFFAQKIVEKNQPQTPEQHINEIAFLFNISLKVTKREVVNEIAEYL